MVFDRFWGQNIDFPEVVFKGCTKLGRANKKVLHSYTSESEARGNSVLVPLVLLVPAEWCHRVLQTAYLLRFGPKVNHVAPIVSQIAPKVI